MSKVTATENLLDCTDFTLVQYIRLICAEELGLPRNYPFFGADALEGETPDETLVRVYHAERTSHDSALETVLVLCHG